MADTMKDGRRPRSLAPAPQYPPLAGVVGLLLGAGVAASCGGNPGGYDRRGPDGTRFYYDASSSTGGELVTDAGATDSGAAGAPSTDSDSGTGGTVGGDGQSAVAGATDAGAPRSP
jgi:hypothetical protein